RWGERPIVRCLFLLICGVVLNAQASPPTSHEFGGYLKVRGGVQTFADDSGFHALTGSGAADVDTDFRLLFSADRGPWDLNIDGQGIVLYGDKVKYTRELSLRAPGFETLFGRLPNDDQRWWNLTNIVEDDDKLAVIGRLDRLSVGYTGERASIRFGRQAISWGNGLMFTPMDIVNPFDPTQVDTEYKAGDDMLYGQLLRANGDDVQATYVVRRNPVTGEVASNQATLAAKYHKFSGTTEFDFLLADHYADALLAVGGSHTVGGAVWRADLVVSETEDEGAVTQFVINTSYSWVWGGRNVSGSAEYFYNGFGQSDGCYSPSCLADNPELLKRVSRGQLFNLGQHYLGGSLTIEMTPLFTLTPILFWNVGDGSALLQIVTQNSLGDNLVLLGALGVPIGSNGTEYGGIGTEVPGVYFSTVLSLFAQLGWYF
ncbi:hypothetical protein ACFL17_02345, partial [Pseudomonadota bacterium]